MTAIETLAMAHEAVRLEAHTAPNAMGMYCTICWEIIDAH